MPFYTADVCVRAAFSPAALVAVPGRQHDQKQRQQPPVLGVVGHRAASPSNAACVVPA